MTRRFLTVTAALAVLPFGAGCSSMSHTAEGAGIGGAAGAGLGALIGKANNGKAGQGALIGGLAGATIGGLIGNEKDQQEKAALQAQAAANARQVGMMDVIRMTQDHQSESVIIRQIQTTNSVYTLSAEDLRTLKDNGVSDAVINEMQCRRADMYPRTRYIAVPAPPPVIYAPPPPVVIAPPPPPGFGVGVVVRP